MALGQTPIEVSNSSDFWNPHSRDEPKRSSSRVILVDFWAPTPAEHEVDSSTHLDDGNSPLFDFWMKSQVLRKDYQPPEDWGHLADLPSFNSQLRENPYLFKINATNPTSIAERRGRWLAQVLDLPQPSRRRAFCVFFAGVFEEFPSHQTFRALMDIALADTDPETLKSACEFKLDFLETPMWASRRSPQQRAPHIYHLAESTLSWRRAVQIAKTCGGENPSLLIQDDWYSDWTRLAYGNELYWSFLDYVEWRLKAKDIGYEYIHQSVFVTDLGRRSTWAFSRTGNLARGQDDIIGVLHQYPRSAIVVVRDGVSKIASERMLGED